MKRPIVALKNRLPATHVGIADDEVCLGRDLARVLAGIRLPADEAKACCRDLYRARKVLEPPADKWLIVDSDSQGCDG